MDVDLPKLQNMLIHLFTSPTPHATNPTPLPAN
jgi:hypothetical protein